jgi:uncharacterized membrane protein
MVRFVFILPPLFLMSQYEQIFLASLDRESSFVNFEEVHFYVTSCKMEDVNFNPRNPSSCQN